MIMSNCNVNPVKPFLAYSRSIEVSWFYEQLAGWYPDNDAIPEVTTVPLRIIPGKNRAADMSPINCMVD